MSPAPGPRELPVLRCASAEEWEQWLARQSADARGVWLQIAKKGCQPATVSYAEALDCAICFGWIDGQKRGHDDVSWLQRFTPRGPRSRWSQVNRAKAEALIAAGRMRPAGQAQIDAARADGRWEAAYEPQSAATVAPDLQAALDANPAAAAFFATLTGARRYAFLYRLHHVSTAKARERRIASYIELLSEGRDPPTKAQDASSGSAGERQTRSQRSVVRRKIVDAQRPLAGGQGNFLRSSEADDVARRTGDTGGRNIFRPPPRRALPPGRGRRRRPPPPASTAAADVDSPGGE